MGNIGISAKAVARLREQIVNSCLEAGIGFRVLVSTDKSGKETFSVKIDRQHKGDKVTDSDGIKIFLDSASVARISDYQLDYQDEPGGGFFLSTMQEVKGG